MSRIAILFHERDFEPKGYIIHQLAEIWREHGHEINYSFGTRRFQPAELAILHVNLSVVPDSYIALAAQYPNAINLHATDIRKSRISTNLIQHPDDWDGPVIVKSDLNYEGEPERLMQRWPIEKYWRGARRIREFSARRGKRQSADYLNAGYRIYSRMADIPDTVLEQRGTVIERFLPETDGELFYTRFCQVLGDRCLCTRLAARTPVVKAGNSVHSQNVDPPAELPQWRSIFGLDYGKLDYVVHNGESILLDINKTIGATMSLQDHPELIPSRRYLAAGIHSYL